MIAHDYEPVDCPDCEGTGWIQFMDTANDTMSCSRCDSTGTVAACQLCGTPLNAKWDYESSGPWTRHYFCSECREGRNSDGSAPEFG